MKQRVPVNGTVLAAEVSGREDGSWIVVSNSLGATTAMWEDQLGVLEPHLRLLRYDTRGHGDSDTPPGPYAFDDLVADVVALMDHYGIDRAHYMGLSLGGMTGLGLALAHPDRVDRLIVCDARADAPEPFLKSWDDRIAMIEAGGITSIWEGTAARWFTPATVAARPDVVARLKAEFERTSPAGYIACAAALKRLDYLNDLGSLSLPTLYVVGDQDAGAPPAAMQEMADATPDGFLVEIADAAHIANVDNPAAFNMAIGRFLGLG